MLVWVAILEEMSTNIPPEPTDVIYEDLMVEPGENLLRELAGNSLVVVLFISYLPAVMVTSCPRATATPVKPPWCCCGKGGQHRSA